MSRAKVLLVAIAIATSTMTTGIAGAGESFDVRGVYGEDSSVTGFDEIAASGFNTVNSWPDLAALDALEDKGLRAVIWLGSYVDDECRFLFDDGWVRTKLSAVAGHPAIAAYQIDDEPGSARVAGCASVPDDIARRSDLIKSIDPTKPTYVTLSVNDGAESYPYEYFAGTADIFGLVVYPCNVNHGCQFEKIERAVAEAESQGIDRYWAVVQAYGDSYYELPSYAELRQQIDEWSQSEAEGYFIYEWPGLGGLTTAERSTLDVRFLDVPRDNMFFDDVTWLAANDITRGCDSAGELFCPDDLVTRGQMAAFLVRALGYERSGGGDLFGDDDESVFEADLDALGEAGVLRGCNPPINDRACPDDFVTRGQLAAFLARALTS